MMVEQTNKVTILNYLANPADIFANRFTIKYGTGTGEDPIINLGKLLYASGGAEYYWGQ